MRPVATQIETVDEDDTFTPCGHVEESVHGSGNVQLEMERFGTDGYIGRVSLPSAQSAHPGGFELERNDLEIGELLTVEQKRSFPQSFLQLEVVRLAEVGSSQILNDDVHDGGIAHTEIGRQWSPRAESQRRVPIAPQSEFAQVFNAHYRRRLELAVDENLSHIPDVVAHLKDAAGCGPHWFAVDGEAVRLAVHVVDRQVFHGQHRPALHHALLRLITDNISRLQLELIKLLFLPD